MNKKVNNNNDRIQRGYWDTNRVADYLSISTREVNRLYRCGILPEPHRDGKKCVRWCVDKLSYWTLLDRPRREIFEPQWKIKREKMAMAF